MDAVKPTLWHNQAAWALESEALRVVVVPELGAKIASLFDRRANFEWLVGPMRPLQRVAFGATFVDQDMSGWDEMFPTILACPYPAPGPFFGRPLPDHGEVWSLPWAVDTTDLGTVACQVAGRALPYRLQRTARLPEPGTLRLDYSAENTGSEPFYCLWAAHPQFTADADTAIQLPEHVKEVYNVVDAQPWGAHGTRYAWPRAVTNDGAQWQLDRIGPASRRDCRKFYVLPDQRATWGALVNRRAGTRLKMEWSAEQLPYLGIWTDEGAFNAAPTAALEPSDGFFDGLARAYANGQCIQLAPGQRRTWTVTLSVSPA